MASRLTLKYDRVGDILYIQNCRPYAEQDSDELGDQIIGRMNPETGQVESLEILFFSTRLRDGGCELPVTAEMYPAE
jgi:uncharacterized protein DUF2283